MIHDWVYAYVIHRARRERTMNIGVHSSVVAHTRLLCLLQMDEPGARFPAIWRAGEQGVMDVFD
jgi:hypothetical protein